MTQELFAITMTSFKVASFSCALVLLLSLSFSFFYWRYPNIFFRAAELLIYLPLAMPPVVVGYGLLVLFSPNGTLGKFFAENCGFEIAFSFYAAVLSCVCVSLGIAVRGLRAAIEKVDQEQINIAKLMGANSFQQFVKIILPQCRSQIFACALLVFVRSLGEFGATMVFAGNTLGETRTFALGIWTSLQDPNKGHETLSLVLLAMGFSLVALLVLEKFNNKSQ